MNVNPYLHFNGTCREAFDFYARVLGGSVVMSMPHRDSPMAEHVGPEWQDKIMHACLAVGDRHIMGSDCPPAFYAAPKGFSVSLSPETVERAEEIFAALSEGGDVGMPLAETFWAKRFGIVADRFGIPWMVNCEKPMDGN